MSSGTGRRAVAIGGGTGQPQVLRCLLDLGFETSAVVTMADDGGSSGVLRRELGILPPGDVRNCLVAMADDEHSMLARVFQYRFSAGEGLEGHSLGNLVLAALTDLTGDFTEAIEAASRSLGARGLVHPSTLEDVVLHGVDRSGTEVIGQAQLAHNPRAVCRVFLEPDAPDAYPPALDVIRNADVVVIGPGSLYTSIIPNFLVAGIADALRGSRATRVYVCNVANLRGETGGLDAADHVEALFEHGLEGAIDAVLVHESSCPDGALCEDESGIEPVASGGEVKSRIESLGVKIVTADLADPDDPVRHAREPLRAALEKVVS